MTIQFFSNTDIEVILVILDIRVTWCTSYIPYRFLCAVWCTGQFEVMSQQSEKDITVYKGTMDNQWNEPVFSMHKHKQLLMSTIHLYWVGSNSKTIAFDNILK